ncbi:MAG TPA: efflux RND transporter permease subunit [bacterium]|nr:efflux RND transporter permease subunit [bacterium]
MNFSEKAVRKPVSTLMGILAVLMVGFVVLPRLPIDFLPNIERNTISVSTRYEGAGPQEIERLITEPIERAVSTVNNVKHINSTSREGSSNVRIEFNWGTDMAEAMNYVRDKVSVAKRSLPDDAEDPVISKFDFSMLPILQLTITGNMPTVDLKDYVENELRYRLEQIEGVASVDISGGETREIHVYIDQDKLASLNIPIDDVVDALERENKDTPGGFVKQGDKEFLIRNRGEFTGVGSIKSVLITYQGNSPIYVKDVAEVTEGIVEKRSDTRLMGRQGVMISIRKQSGDNTVKVADRVKTRVEEIRKTLPPGVVIKTMMDNSTMIRDSIAELRRSAVIGGILAVIVLFVFLVNIRSTLIIFVSVPFSVVSTFIFLYFTGLTLNIMSLGGLALGVGRIVDDSIVVLENIYRHRTMGEGRVEAAINGAREVSMAVTASTATTICVFLPLVLVSGMSGIFFKELGITVTISLISSLVVSLTLIPMLCSRFLKVKIGDEHSTSVYERGIYKYYGGLLDFSLKHKTATMIFVLIILIGGILLLKGKIGYEYLPQVDEGQISVNFELPVGTKLEVTQREMKKLEKIIIGSVKEIDNMYSQVGSSSGMGGGGGASGVNAGSFRIMLIPSDKREKSTTEIVNMLREKLMRSTKGKVWVNESGSIMQRILGGGESRLELDIRGHDMAPADALALKVSDIVASTPGAANPRISRTPGMPEMNIVVDREKAATLGFSPSYVSDVVKTNVDGAIATRLRRGSDEIDIRVRQRPEDRKNLEAVGNILLSSNGAPPVPLRSLVKFVKNTGPVQIERLDQERIVTVTASYTGEKSPGDVNAEIEKRIKNIVLPTGFSIEFAGEELERKEASSSMTLAFILAICLVYMVMATQFESLLHPFIIIFAVPLSLLGVMLSLYVTRTNFSLMANLGAIMLAGIVVTNGIVLIDFVNQLRRKGTPIDEAVARAGRLRLRPIVMTAMATVLGLIPLALGIGRGSEMQAPLARVVIGGMIVATSLTLLFVPVLYASIEGAIERKRNK